MWTSVTVNQLYESLAVLG